MPVVDIGPVSYPEKQVSLFNVAHSTQHVVMLLHNDVFIV